MAWRRVESGGGSRGSGGMFPNLPSLSIPVKINPLSIFNRSSAAKPMGLGYDLGYAHRRNSPQKLHS